MRLTEHQAHVLAQSAVKAFDPQATVRLFGSRLNDGARGGDIDILVQTQLNDPVKIAQAHIRFLAEVYTHLGEQKIDVLIDYPSREARSAVFDVALAEGVLLK